MIDGRRVRMRSVGTSPPLNDLYASPARFDRSPVSGVLRDGRFPSSKEKNVVKYNKKNQRGARKMNGFIVGW